MIPVKILFVRLGGKEQIWVGAAAPRPPLVAMCLTNDMHNI